MSMQSVHPKIALMHHEAGPPGALAESKYSLAPCYLTKQQVYPAKSTDLAMRNEYVYDSHDGIRANLFVFNEVSQADAAWSLLMLREGKRDRLSSSLQCTASSSDNLSCSTNCSSISSYSQSNLQCPSPIEYYPSFSLPMFDETLSNSSSSCSLADPEREMGSPSKMIDPLGFIPSIAHPQKQSTTATVYFPPPSASIPFVLSNSQQPTPLLMQTGCASLSIEQEPCSVQLRSKPEKSYMVRPPPKIRVHGSVSREHTILRCILVHADTNGEILCGGFSLLDGNVIELTQRRSYCAGVVTFNELRIMVKPTTLQDLNGKLRFRFELLTKDEYQKISNLHQCRPIPPSSLVEIHDHACTVPLSNIILLGPPALSSVIMTLYSNYTQMRVHERDAYLDANVKRRHSHSYLDSVRNRLSSVMSPSSLHTVMRTDSSLSREFEHCAMLMNFPVPQSTVSSFDVSMASS